MSIRNEVIDFYQKFVGPSKLPTDLELINPYADEDRRNAIHSFYDKYYDDSKVRVHVLGINPSRMHKTATGINYTDGFALSEYCGIDNSFSKTRELTADFFYRVVNAMGGPSEFFARIFPWAMMPVCVTKQGDYANYYEESVVEHLRDLVEENVRWTSKLPSTGKLVILGTGENHKFFEGMPGSPFGYNEVRVVPHPRWVMQYNRSKLDDYIDQYIEALS